MEAKVRGLLAQCCLVAGYLLAVIALVRIMLWDWRGGVGGEVSDLIAAASVVGLGHGAAWWLLEGVESSPQISGDE